MPVKARAAVSIVWCRFSVCEINVIAYQKKLNITKSLATQNRTLVAIVQENVWFPPSAFTLAFDDFSRFSILVPFPPFVSSHIASLARVLRCDLIRMVLVWQQMLIRIFLGIRVINIIGMPMETGCGKQQRSHIDWPSDALEQLYPIQLFRDRKA